MSAEYKIKQLNRDQKQLLVEGTRLLDKYIDDDTPEKIQFLSEPGESHVEENLRESFNVFIRIATIFFEQFGLEDFLKKTGELTKDSLKLYNKNIDKYG